jgi:hypothetical protein
MLPVIAALHAVRPFRYWPDDSIVRPWGFLDSQAACGLSSSTEGERGEVNQRESREIARSSPPMGDGSRAASRGSEERTIERQHRSGLRRRWRAESQSRGLPRRSPTGSWRKEIGNATWRLRTRRMFLETYGGAGCDSFGGPFRRGHELEEKGTPRGPISFVSPTPSRQIR